ncbi:MAG TPA: hypothetical protein VK302_00750 [Terriglobales bacterium]|nr:hypothetical protein [Terriglobales bacterium]
MRNFNAWELAMLLRRISSLHRHAQTQCDTGNRDELVPRAEVIDEVLTPILQEAERLSKLIELDSTWKRVWHGGGPFFFAVAMNLTFQQLMHELEVLRQAIEADLEDRTFVFVPQDDAKMLDMEDAWSSVWAVMPESQQDVEEAIKCYTLDRHTAAVFHSMRIAEYGLRHLARKLRVKLTHTHKAMPVEFADWEKVITGIKNKIQTVRTNQKLPVGPKRQEQLEKCSDAADHCVYMKDIWRNNISHTRKPYKKTEALNVIERVRDFMQFVSTNFK